MDGGRDSIFAWIDRRTILVFFIPFMAYFANGREISSGDPTPTFFTAVHIAKHGTVFLDRLREYIPYHSLPYYVSEQGGRLVSNYPVFPGVMAVPLVAPAAWAGLLPEGENQLVWGYLMKLTGTLYTSLSVLFLYLTLRLLIPLGGAFALAMAYGLGTALWPVASQSLWQHGPSVFWWTVCLHFLLRAAMEEGGETPANPIEPKIRSLRVLLLLAGTAAGCAVLCRTVNGIGAAVLCAAVWLRLRGPSPWFIAPAAALAMALIGYNLWVFGSWKGGDTVLHSLQWELDRISGGAWDTPLPAGLAGQLISPSRGLLIFSPFLAFAAWGAVAARRDERPSRRLILPMAAAPLLMLLVFSKYSVWWGGNSHYGPRYQIETYPFLMLALACAWPRVRRSRVWLSVFLAALAWSVWVQWVGAFCYPGGWTVEPVPLWEDKARFWDWSYNQIWTCAKSGVKKPFLFMP